MTIASLLLSLNDYVRQSPGESILVSIVLAPIIYLFINEIVRNNARISNMKGPSGLPVIGNLWDIRVNAADKYREWSKKFGEVYQIQLGNVPVVVINSAGAARDIFGKHAQAFSSRPEFYTFHKVCLSLYSPNHSRVNPSTRFSPTLLERLSARLPTVTR